MDVFNRMNAILHGGRRHMVGSGKIVVIRQVASPLGLIQELGTRDVPRMLSWGGFAGTPFSRSRVDDRPKCCSANQVPWLFQPTSGDESPELLESSTAQNCLSSYRRSCHTHTQVHAGNRITFHEIILDWYYTAAWLQIARYRGEVFGPSGRRWSLCPDELNRVLLQLRQVRRHYRKPIQ